MPLVLNNYNTITGVVGTNPATIYTSPVGYSAIVLLAQVTNIGNTTQTINFAHVRGGVTTEILQGFPIPNNDSANLLTGKLVLEPGDSLVLSSSSASDVKYISSVLETLNQ